MELTIHSFINSGHFYSAPSSPLLLKRRSRLQHGYCIGVSHRSAQATAGKGLAQGPYMAARAGGEPTTLRLKVIDSTKAPPCPTSINMSIFKLISVSQYVNLDPFSYVSHRTSTCRCKIITDSKRCSL